MGKGYDPEKDKQLWTHLMEGSDIILSVYQYGDSPPKLGLARRYSVKGNDEPRFKKLGRVTKEEALRILALLPLAIEKLNIG